MKVGFCTLGCKVNQYETNVMIEKLNKAGFEIVDFNNKADIYVINTCTVTNMSDRKSRQMLKKAKKQNKEAIVIVTGCLAQVGSEELSKIKEIDLILGNEQKKEIDKYIKEYVDNNSKEKINVSDIMKEESYTNEMLTTFYDKVRAIIKVQDGCNNYCSYCIIPYARGKVRSKESKDVIEEATSIAKNGYKEIVITGIHVASYGKDLDNITLIDLIEKISEIEGIERIRLGSLEPTIITTEFLDRLIKINKFCPHFHLSLQSGCNDTLKRMNRKYTIEQFEGIVNLIRQYYIDANITTDIIVGFPGETEQEFNETYNFLKKIKLTKTHVFQYSQRKGTVASKMENQVNPNIKHARSEKLIELSNKNELEFLKRYLDKKVEILVEEKDKEYVKGFTKNYLHVKVKSDFKINTINNVKIEKIENNVLISQN